MNGLVLADYHEVGSKVLEGDSLTKSKLKSWLQYGRHYRLAFFHIYGAPLDVVPNSLRMFSFTRDPTLIFFYF